MLDRVRRELVRDFDGRLREFTVPVDPQGTEFRRRVWAELRAIPHGVTAPYGEIARRIRSPSAARAVGAAKRREPIAIVVPCHRVIGANGSLTGFGGGLDCRRHSLDLERSVVCCG